LTVYVGDATDLVTSSALAFDSDAFLLEYDNSEQFLTSSLSKDTTVYTSLHDVSAQLLIDICLHADCVVYCPPVSWLDQKQLEEFNPTVCDHGYTEYLLMLLSWHVNVVGLNVPNIQNPNELVDSRKSTNKQLWIAGCSISHGMGVEESQRYGALVAKELDLPCSFLTRPGASIEWACDQICRSDVQENDIVVLGVTSVERFSYIYNKKLLPGVTLRSYDFFNLEIKRVIPEYHLVTENTFYQHINAIERVINFCQKVKANLVLFGVLSNTSAGLLRYLNNKHNFFPFPYKFNFHKEPKFIYSDYGSDHEHPGTRQHQLYADYLSNKIKNLNYH